MPLARLIPPISKTKKAIALGLIAGLIITSVFWTLAGLSAANKAKIDVNNRLTATVCAESNKLRDAERGLWDLIIQLSRRSPDPRTSEAERRKSIKEFQDYINSAFKHIDCGAEQGKGKKPPALVFPVVTQVKTDTRVRTIYVQVPVSKVKTVVVCKLPNGRPVAC